MINISKPYSKCYKLFKIKSIINLKSNIEISCFSGNTRDIFILNEIINFTINFKLLSFKSKKLKEIFVTLRKISRDFNKELKKEVLV